MGLYWWSINRKRDTREKVEEETSYLRVAWICVGGKGVTGPGRSLGKAKNSPQFIKFFAWLLLCKQFSGRYIFTNNYHLSQTGHFCTILEKLVKKLKEKSTLKN